MIHTFQNDTAAVMRYTTVSGNRRALATVFTADGGPQNIDTKFQRATDGVESKSYVDWFDVDLDIREGDVIHYRDTDRRMRVIGVEKHGQGLGLISEHLEVTMNKYSK